MKRIKHQTQPTPFSCIATCLAMLMNRSAHYVDKEFTQAYAEQKVDVPMALAPFGIMCKPHFSAGIHNLNTGSLYLATVPSLMTSGLFHQIIIDTRAGIVEVYDPGKGMTYRTQHYVRSDSPVLNHDDPYYDKLAFPLRTWIIDYEITFTDD